jgi:hypothetical protein
MDKAKALEILRAGIQKHSPVVAEFFGREEKLSEYSKTLYQYESNPIHLKRQEVLAKAMEEKIKKLFNHEVKLNLPLTINIVDHHAILNHPMLIATNVIANAHQLLENKKSIVVLTSSIVPPNNFFNKKGFELHEKRVQLFSNQEMHQASVFIPLHEFDFVKKLKNIGHWNKFSESEQAFLEMINREIQNLHFKSCQNYDDQISIINAHLWKQLFSREIRDKVPDLFYLPQEHIINSILPQFLKEENIISKALFNKSFRESVLEAFSGIAGTWDEENKKGTHFFWYRDSDNEAKRLILQGENLVSDDKLIKIPLETETLSNKLQNFEIIPGMFVIFGLIVFWFGARPLVGHGSSTYLTRMKEAWLKVLSDSEEANRIKSINTKGLIASPVVTFTKENGVFKNKFAFDVIMDGGMTKDYLDHLLSMKFKDLLKPALLDVYSYVPVSERIDLGLKPSDLIDNEFDWLV